jgi:hypothetical protein
MTKRQSHNQWQGAASAATGQSRQILKVFCENEHRKAPQQPLNHYLPSYF